MISKEQFPLIIKRVHNLPVNSSDSPGLPYEFAKLNLQDKGILYGLDYSGDMEYQILEIFRFGWNYRCLWCRKEKHTKHHH